MDAGPLPLTAPIARPRAPGALRLLSSVHRWVGVCLCLMFALWFASGSVLLFVPFPALSHADRLSHLPRIRVHDVHIAPSAAIAASVVADPAALRLIEGPDGPIYVLGAQDGSVSAVSASDGRVMAGITPDGASRLAAAFTGRAVRGVAGPYGYDQWTVHRQFDPLRPFYRVSVDGADGLQLYVSARTGDIVQQTRHGQRAWNMVGAVVHWIYPTIIRRSFPLWDNLVWCLSLVGVGLAASGLTLGLVRARRSLRRANRPTVSPFRGLFRWHHITGLGAGVFLLSWIFSGWLSMDHGRIFSTGAPTATELAAYRGTVLAQAAALVRPADMMSLDGVGEVELSVAGGHAFLVGRADATTPPRVVALDTPDHPTLNSLPEPAIAAGIRAAWPATRVVSIAAVPLDDPYEHVVTEPMTDRLTRIVLADGAGTWVEVYADTGQIKTLLDRSRRIYRWVYYGMHTFDLPGLSSHEALRRGLILCLLAGGELLSLTGVVLGLKRIRRSFRRRGRAFVPAV